MGYCRASAVRLLEKELATGKYQDVMEAVNVAVSKSQIRLDSKEKHELIHLANLQKRNQMIVKYFI